MPTRTSEDSVLFAELNWGSAALGIAASIALAAAVADWRHRIIPHWLTGLLALLWLPVALWAPAALDASPSAALLCGAFGLGLGWALYALGWLGGGDGKLLGVLALWLGPKDVGTALLGAVPLGVALTAWGLASPSFRARGVPMAVAIGTPAAMLFLGRAASLNS